MEEKQPNSTTTLNEEDDQYFDSFEDFPFLDCTSNPESPEEENSTEISNISQLSSSMQERADILIERQITTQSDEISSNEKNGMLKSDVESTETSKEEIFTENSLASSSFLVYLAGGFVMRCLVEEPMQLVESLNFDYTRTSPVALVPIISCPSVYTGVKYQDGIAKNVAGFRVLPPNHKLQLTVLLTMPESDYNRKLGIFQVRVDFLSENGQVTASSRHPCMLQFKSHLIRYLEIFLKSVPLLAGYSSEAQVLKIRMRGFSEGYKPTSCIRVILEQRAEYRSGAGLPEIYGASILLESELPLLKRILWYWKRTIFIWISMVSFTMELMLVLLCCRPILIPTLRPGRSSTSNAPQTSVSPVVSS
ncbi:hypothetical protein IFM89_016821 [Coptis chinensis]|uniref:Seipin n=1 Tax=Coptis chinensis TaxID=261450 RepID=A0A835GZN0_9MAGN|nr:hypothetical protein IFM89_016821 [Coptis chinensis]